MGVHWLPTVLNMSEDIPHQCPIIKDIIRVGTQDSAITAFILLATQQHVFYRQGLSSSVSQAVFRVMSMRTKVYQQCWKEWAGRYA